MKTKKKYSPYRCINRQVTKDRKYGISLMEVKKTGARYYQNGNAIAMRWETLKAFWDTGVMTDDIKIIGSWQDTLDFIANS